MTWSVEQADCIAFLNSLEEGSVDLVFGSPPYEMARLYLEDGKDMGIARKTEEWVAWMVEVYTAAQRACKGLVAFVVAGQTRKFRWSAGPALLAADLHRAGFCLRNPPIYHRVGIPGSGGPDWWRADYEWIICTARPGKLPWSDNVATGHKPKFEPGGAMSYRGPDGERKNAVPKTSGSDYRKANGRKLKFKRSKLQTDRGGGGEATEDYSWNYVPPAKANPGNVLRCKVGGGLLGSELAHLNEAPFPEALADAFVRSFCPPGGMTCDPFTGSGTTAAVAVRHGRNFKGCDLRQSQVDLARRRISAETPLALFGE